MMKTLSYGSLILLFLNGPALAQEILTGLEVNSSVRDVYRQQPALKSIKGSLELPFFDDFSGSDVYPDSRKWSDRYVFINSDYPVNPISVNVATLDAIDHTGALYEHATTWPFPADRLTSNAINLAYPASDSIYLSFFYQPQGRGDIPQTHDSLRVEFFSPETEDWRVAWSVPGDSLHEFKLVMLPLSDPEYLQDGFRFRFSNIASIADNRHNPGTMGNCDHWHVDYVYLNRGRTYADTVFSDVAFIKPIRSVLNNYEAMPWNQFQAGRIAEMGSVLPVAYRNLDNTERIVQRNFSIYDVYENRTAHSFPGGAAGIGPRQIHDFNADLTWSFTSANPDSALFRVRAWLTVEGLEPRYNDTVVYHQRFSNYFALDDGTAENGYGLAGGGSENARIACRFRAYRADSLRAIKIYFNQSLNHASRQYFNLAVWDDDNGRPGNIIYLQEGLRPVYEDELNRFHTYHLDNAVPVSQIFYVGIIQTTTEFLNIGFDVNRNNRNRLFYNIFGEWRNSSFEGSLMIRPVVGESHPPLSVADPPGTQHIRVYPNPARDILFIDTGPESAPGSATYSLINSAGQIVYQEDAAIRSIDVSKFPAGIYFVRIEFMDGRRDTRKVLITP